MPNHVENDLYLNGPTEAVDAALAFIGVTETPPVFDFDRLLPYPSPYKEMDDDHKTMIPEMDYRLSRDSPEWEAQVSARQAGMDAYCAKWKTHRDGFNTGGYEWRCRVWETKWGAYDVKRRDYERTCVTYQTAWSPSKSAIVALAQRFPAVSFSLEYFERGMSFCGGFTCPSEDDHYGDVPWQPGIVVSEWHTDQYLGTRGG